MPHWPIVFIAVLLHSLSLSASAWSEAKPISYMGRVDLIDWNGLALRSSSELKPAKDNTYGPYSIIRAFDRRVKTCWSEGVMDSGIGQYILFSVPEGTDALRIANGYQKTRWLFLANNRIKRIVVSLSIGLSIDGEVTERYVPYHIYQYGDPRVITIKDKFGYQDVPFRINWPEIKRGKETILVSFCKKNLWVTPNKIKHTYLAKITIDQVFRGSKYNDTCISEVVPMVTTYPGLKIFKVYTNDTENTIFMDTTHGRRIILDRDPSAVFQIIAKSPENQWVIAIKMPTHIGSSRAETSYFLYNTFLKSKLPSHALGQHVGELYDFEKINENGTICLNYLNLTTMNIDQLDIDTVKQLFIKTRMQGDQKDNKTKGGPE